MQNTKDSFYEVLRGRLNALNPDSTVVIRGVTRPALVVDENEGPNSAPLPDCFHLRWIGITALNEGVLPLIALDCEIRYASAGSGWNSGFDRGRVLATMDGALLTAISRQPQSATKLNYSALASGGIARPMQSKLWWSDPVFGPIEVEAERVGRTVKLQVMSYQETGELW